MNQKVVLAMRLVLGLIFFVFGLNFFFHFLPFPGMNPQAMAYMGGLMAAPYFFPVLKITEVVCGALLLLGWYVPLALVILAPVVLHIVLFHAILAPEAGLPMAILLLVLELALAWAHKESFSDLLRK